MRQVCSVLVCSLFVVLAGCTSNESRTPADPAAAGPAASEAQESEQSKAGSAPSQDGRRWCVTGSVTDEFGNPLPDVEITAHCGAGTLLPTGHATSDADGQYVLRFGPAMLFHGDHSGLQAATIAPYKRGWIERNLHRQGDLRIAHRRPDDAELNHWGPAEAVIYPDEPRRVDFVMVPAATIAGRLVDSAGQPIANHYVSVNTEELPPSSSVLASMKTDELGAFRFTEAPPGQAWLSIRTPEDVMHEVCTEKLTCRAQEPTNVELAYDPGPPARLRVRTVEPR